MSNSSGIVPVVLCSTAFEIVSGHRSLSPKIDLSCLRWKSADPTRRDGGEQPHVPQLYSRTGSTYALYRRTLRWRLTRSLRSQRSPPQPPERRRGKGA